MIGNILAGLRSFLPTSLATDPQRHPEVGDQLPVMSWGGELSGRINEIIGEYDPKRLTMSRMIQMRDDPDVAFGTAMVRAPIINMNWRIDSRDPKIAAFVTAVVKKIFRPLAKSISNAMPFGYKVAELVWQTGPFAFEIDGNDGTKTKVRLPMAWTIKRTKPINGESLTLLVDPLTGEFLGVRQSGYGPKDVTVAAIQLALWSFRDEDVNGSLKGHPMFRQVYKPWHSKETLQIARDAYLKRNADPLPIGRAVIDQVRDEKGTMRDGYGHMRRVLSSRRNGAAVILPSTIDEKTGKYKFDIQYLEDSGKATDAYQIPIQYEGIQILRAFGITDEVGTSQEMGGRARSETHADTFSDTAQGFVDEAVDEVLNPQVVDRLVLNQFGQEALEESETRLVAAGISAGLQDTYREVLKAVMDGEAMLQQGSAIPLRKRIDAVGICKSLDIPLLPEDEVEPDPAPEQPDDGAPDGDVTPEDEAAAMKELKRRGATDMDFVPPAALGTRLGIEDLGEIRTTVSQVVQEALAKIVPEIVDSKLRKAFAEYSAERKIEELASEPPPAPESKPPIELHVHQGNITLPPQQIDIKAGDVKIDAPVNFTQGDTHVKADLNLKPGDKKSVTITGPDGKISTAEIKPGGNA